jgi:hypothetical protein
MISDWVRVSVNGDWSFWTDGDTWQVASDGAWLPGIYADEAAARKALTVARRNYLALEKLASFESRGGGISYRPITVEDLHQIPH